MIGINKGAIIANLRTLFMQARAGVQPRPLGKGKIVAVVIQNRLNNIDATANGVELMVGDGGGQIYQMLPGQESPLIYADDLEDIWIRVRAGATEVDVPLFVYREKGQG